MPIPSELKLENIESIVVANIDSLGDATWTTPLFQELRATYPNAMITVLCNQVCTDIFSDNPYISHIIPISPLSFYQSISHSLEVPDLKDKSIDLFIIAEMGVRPADNLRILAKTLKAKYIISSDLGILKKVPHYKGAKNLDTSPLWWPHSFLKLLTPLTNKEYTEEPPLQLYSNINADQKIATWISEQKLENKNLILVHPMVAGYGLHTKKWSNSNFHEVIHHLLKNPDNYILVSGGPDEQEICRQFTQEVTSSPNILSIAGKFSIKEISALLPFISLTLSCDTSMLHFSIASSTPTIAIFGATNSHKIAPHSFEFVKVFHSTLPCWPCHKNKDFSPYWPTCIYNDAKCLQETTPGMVIDYIRKKYPDLIESPSC